MELGAIVFWALLLAMVVVVVITIARGSVSGGGSGSGAGMPGVTALHDLSPADKQRAFEIVVEQKAGKKWVEQDSGKTRDDSKTPPPAVNPPA